MENKFTVKQAADYLGVTRQKIHQLLKDGALIPENNPMDKRQKLISLEQLDKLKAYIEPKPEVAPKLTPSAPELVKLKFTGQVKDNAWAVGRELDLTISQVKNYMLKNPGLMGLPYEELKKAVAEKFKR